MVPENRGYDGFDGTFGHVDGFTLTRDGVMDLNLDTNGTFSSALFGDKAVEFIESQEFSDQSFFLHLREQFILRGLLTTVSSNNPEIKSYQ